MANLKTNQTEDKDTKIDVVWLETVIREDGRNLIVTYPQKDL